MGDCGAGDDGSRELVDDLLADQRPSLPDTIEERRRSESGPTVQPYESSLLAEHEPRWLRRESIALSLPWRGAVPRWASAAVR